MVELGVCVLWVARGVIEATAPGIDLRGGMKKVPIAGSHRFVIANRKSLLPLCPGCLAASLHCWQKACAEGPLERYEEETA